MLKRFVKVLLYLGLLVGSGMAWSKPRTIFDYSSELKLAESQTRALSDLLRNLSSQSRQLQATLLKQERTFRDQVVKQTDLTEVQRSLDRIRKTRIGLRMLDITTQRQLEEVLTPEQRKQWKSIQLSMQKSPKS